MGPPGVGAALGRQFDGFWSALPIDRIYPHRPWIRKLVAECGMNHEPDTNPTPEIRNGQNYGNG